MRSQTSKARITFANLGDPLIRTYKYLDVLMAAFITILLCTDLIGAAKVVTIGGLTFGGTLLFFPMTYLFGDVLTEVYGYRASRKVIWAGFGALAFASFAAWLIVALPPADGWHMQNEVAAVFSQTPRLACASMIAYWAGEFANSFTLAKMKIASQGRWPWLRYTMSTVVGEAVDTAIIYPGAFYGLWANDLLIKVMITSYFVKVAWEVLALPVTSAIANFLKRAEGVDHFDVDTRFSPFSAG